MSEDGDDDEADLELVCDKQYSLSKQKIEHGSPEHRQRYIGVDGRKWVVQKVDVAVAVDGSR